MEGVISVILILFLFSELFFFLFSTHVALVNGTNEYIWPVFSSARYVCDGVSVPEKECVCVSVCLSVCLWW